MIDPVHRPSQARTEHDIKTRLAALEERPSTRIETVDAGGSAWNVSNSAFVAATVYTEWTELRVANTPVGSQVWRALKDSGGSLVWALSAEP